MAQSTTTSLEPFSSALGGSVEATPISSRFEVAGGRVTTLEIANSSSVQSVRVLQGPDHGNLTVNPDNTLALVMSHEPRFSGQIDFSYEITRADGSRTVQNSTVSVQPSTQQAGWGAGNFYMLEEDRNGSIIVEQGDNHRKVYVSGGSDAFSLADIAAREGVGVGQITQAWLVAHPEYGGSAEMALDVNAGMQVWGAINGTQAGANSNWLLFERGHQYNNLSNLIPWGTQGEDPLHPVHITAYGEGRKPVLNSSVNIFGDRPVENVVFSDLDLKRGFTSLEGSNLILDNLSVTNTSTEAGKMGILIDGADGITIHDTTVSDVYYLTPPNGAGRWTGNEMASGLLIGESSGLLIEGSVFDRSGWAPDYDPNLSTSGGQPPGVFSHNVYIDWNNTDVTFRDNISMRAANNGVMIRSGGFLQDNVVMDANSAIVISGGEFEGSGMVGNFTLALGNLITSAGHHASRVTGFLSQGFENAGNDTTLIDNIIAHLADPNNLAEIRNKTTINAALANKHDPFYNDTIIYNWKSGSSTSTASDRNTSGLDRNVLNDTTIQHFAQQVLGNSGAGIPELANLLRQQANGALDKFVDADVIIAFFREGFGLDVDLPRGATEMRFVPNELGDGLRWDNALNWSTGHLPGSVAADNVNLGGNWVNYGGTTTIRNLAFGDGGTLDVGHGRLNVSGETTAGTRGGNVDIFNAGQFWINGYRDADQLDLNVDGGRFANTGTVSGNVEAFITDGQAILATSGARYDINSASVVAITGSDAKVGFDGTGGGLATVQLHRGGTLSFTADAGGFASLAEFHSGRFGNAPNIASGIDLGQGTLEIDVSALGQRAGQHTLVSADELIGDLGDVQLTGLARNMNATLTVDYARDVISLNLRTGGSGAFNVQKVGSESNMDHSRSGDLLDALRQEAPTSGVTLTGANGMDRLYGGNGDDLLNGGRNADRLYGGAGDDTLDGQTGDDRLYGGTGDDRLIGGQGADRFVFEIGDGSDVIVDFDPSQDRLAFRDGVDSRADLTFARQGLDTLVSYEGGTILVKDVLPVEFISTTLLF